MRSPREAEPPHRPVLSLDRTIEKVAEIAADCAPQARTHLDLGCGTGSLIAVLRRRIPGLRSEGGDLFPELMQLADVPVRKVDLNDPALPWPDAHFDLVTLTEVIEHLDGCQRLLREVARVLKPGGWVVLSTPNVLNLASRLRYLLYGFPQMFGPFPFDAPKRETTEGHVQIVGAFHLSFFLHCAGFSEWRADVDKIRWKSLPALVLLYPLLRAYHAARSAYEERRYVRLDDEARKALRMPASPRLLLGRTLVMAGRKP